MTKLRTLLFVVIILTLAVSLFSFVFFDTDFFIRKWNIPTAPPGFFDSQQFAWAAESHAQGYDPLIENPVNPRGQQLNYPRIWHLLFYLGINESHINIMGSIIAVLFFAGAGIFWFSRKFDNFTYFLMSAALLSPPVMLGLERSNIELVLFCILSLALTINYYSVITALSVFLFAAVLKLYPVFGFLYLLKENKKKFLIFVLAASGIFLLYALLSLSDLMHVFKTTPKVVGSSFGMNVWWMGIRHPRFFNIPISDQVVLLLRVFSYVVAFASLAAAFYFSMRQNDSVLDREARYIDAFRVGGGIYVGCFLLMNTIDYRLLFLIFTIPQAVEWIRDKDRGISLVSRITLGAIGFSLWSTFVMRFLGRKITFAMEEFSNWIILAGMLFLLFSSLPDWLKDNLCRPFSSLKHNRNRSIFNEQ